MKRALNLEINIRTVQRTLSVAPHVNYIKQVSSVELSDEHKFKRIDWAQEKLK